MNVGSPEVIDYKVQSSMIHNSFKLEAIQIPINRISINKLVYSDNEYRMATRIHNLQPPTVIRTKEAKEYMLCGSIYIKDKNRQHSWTLLDNRTGISLGGG